MLAYSIYLACTIYLHAYSVQPYNYSSYYNIQSADHAARTSYSAIPMHAPLSTCWGEPERAPPNVTAISN